MFGYLTAACGTLSEEQHRRYRACYCGLCRCLGKHHGQLSRLTLTYDLSFLVLLLSSLYEPEGQDGEGGCLVHPFEKRPWHINEISGYAADMNIALAYMKLRDDWDDDCDPAALFASQFFKSAYRRVCSAWPRQCSAIECAITRLTALEKSGEATADTCAACFGELMGEIFVLYDDRWADTLRAMGRALGCFIYLMDACMDMEKDERLCRYNPFLHRLGMEDNARYFAEILKLYLSECVFYFDRLPLVQDADIMKNILCLGLWAEFNKKYGTEKGPTDVSGSL